MKMKIQVYGDIYDIKIRKESMMKKGIISVISLMAGAAAGVGITGRKMAKTAKKNKKMSDKHLALFLMMNQWVKVKQEGKTLDLYFKKNGYKKIAIYGMSYVGGTLVDELKGTGIEVAYGIDKNVDGIYSDIDIFAPSDNLDDVDAVVVTPIFFVDEIEEMLSARMNCPIISLEDILYEI